MNNKHFKFLVAVDFTDQSNIALDQACNLAKYYNTELTMLFVFDNTRYRGLFSKPVNAKEIKEKAQEKLSEVALKKSEEKGLKIKTLIIDGRIYDAIVDVAHNLDVNLIVMGTNGAQGLKKKFIGTNAIRVIKQADKPVLTIKGKQHRNGCKNIVLPLDLTKETTQKVEEAIEMANMFKGAKIRVISCVWTHQNNIIKKLKTQMEHVLDYIESNNIECTGDIIKIVKSEDSFAKTIIAFSNKVEADVIMIMTQLETNPTEYFIGSSAQTIINKSDVPVLSFVPKVKDGEKYF